jgi:DNA-binding LytR/AlgR family response regulator
LAAAYSSATQVIDSLQNNAIDLIFLDIQMPDLSGIELIKSLTIKPVVIFTTAYSEYAIEGYSLDIIDYLLKPIPFDRFAQAVYKATKQIKILSTNKKESKKTFISLKSEHRIYKVDFDNILYIEGLKEYVIFHLVEGNRIITLESLKKLEEVLPHYFM